MAICNYGNNKLEIQDVNGRIEAIVWPTDGNRPNYERARQFAAAPELVKVLQTIVGEVTAPMGDGGVDFETLERAKAVLEKVGS